MIRPVTKNCFDSLMMDQWPRAAAIVDFGLDSVEHYSALQRCIRAGYISIQELDALLGNGPALTNRINGLFHFPYRIVFQTAYDDMLV